MSATVRDPLELRPKPDPLFIRRGSVHARMPDFPRTQPQPYTYVYGIVSTQHIQIMTSSMGLRLVPWGVRVGENLVGVDGVVTCGGLLARVRLAFEEAAKRVVVAAQLVCDRV